MALLAILSFMQFLKGWSRDTSCKASSVLWSLLRVAHL